MTVIDHTALPAPAALREQFEHRQPFRHFVADGFFANGFAQTLLAQFPAFERGNARNEDGELGGKSTVEHIRELGAAFVAVDDLVRSAGFLEWLSTATGIPNLLYDPWYFGGGTHENRHGQDLDPHVDFNRHPENGWHRRLNLIVYLNPEWHDSWGGSLELHTDPRTADNRITLVTPIFNRCVVFETTESSWHGFSRIELPADKRALSRKSIALYFYTRERPAEELGPTHSTIYVDRPLPEHFKAGHTLTEEDVHTLQTLLVRRDMHNQRLYRELQHVGAGRESGGSHLRRLTSGLGKLYRQRVIEHQPLDRTAIKAAMLPFVANLPAGLRDPLRRQWRSRIALRATEAPTEAQHEKPASFNEHPSIATSDATSCAEAQRTIGAVSVTQAGYFSRREYSLVHHLASDIVRLEPTPTSSDLRILYEESEQFSDEHYTSPAQVERMLSYYGNCLDRFGLLPPTGGASLEVGAGFAWVSRACKLRDAEVTTVAQDVSSECATLCSWVDRYLVCPLNEVPAETTFELISLTHVIEHLTDPAQTLAHLGSRMRQGGKIFVTAPYRPKGWKPGDGIELWAAYSYLHVPAHITYLSETWFRQVAAQCGLSLLHWDASQDDHQAFEAVLVKQS